MRRRQLRSSILVLAAASFAAETVAAGRTAAAVDTFHRRAENDDGGHHRKKKDDLFTDERPGTSDGDVDWDDTGTDDPEERHEKEQDEHDAINGGDVDFEFPPTSLPTKTTMEPSPSPTPKPNPCLFVNGVIGTSETARKFTVDYVYEAETKRRATINSMPEVVTAIEALVSDMLAGLVDAECSEGGGEFDRGGITDKIVGINIDPIDQVLPLKSMDGKCTTEIQSDNRFGKCFVVTGGITFHLDKRLTNKERQSVIDLIISTFGGDDGSGVDYSPNADLLAGVRDDVVRVTLISPSRGPPPTVSPQPSSAPPTLTPKPTVSPKPTISPMPTLSPRPSTQPTPSTREPTVSYEPTAGPTVSPTATPTAGATSAVTATGSPSSANICDGDGIGLVGTTSTHRVGVRYQYEVETRPIVKDDLTMVGVVLPLIEAAVSEMLLPTVFAECRGGSGGDNNGTAIDSSVSLRAFAPRDEHGVRHRERTRDLTAVKEEPGDKSSLRAELTEGWRILQQNLESIVGISSKPTDIIAEGESCRVITTQGDNRCTVVDGDLSLYLNGPESNEGEVVLDRIREAHEGFEFDNINPTYIVKVRYRPVLTDGAGTGILSSGTTESVVYEPWFPYVLAISILSCCVGMVLLILGWRRKGRNDDAEREQLKDWSDPDGEQEGAWRDPEEEQDYGGDAEGEQLHEAEQMEQPQGGYGYDDRLADAEDEQLHEVEQLERPERGYFDYNEQGYNDAYDEGYGNHLT